METSIKNFNYINLSNDEKYIKSVKKYSKMKNTLLKKRLNAKFDDFENSIRNFFILVAFIISLSDDVEVFDIFLDSLAFYPFIGLFLLITFKFREIKIFTKETWIHGFFIIVMGLVVFNSDINMMDSLQLFITLYTPIGLFLLITFKWRKMKNYSQSQEVMIHLFWFSVIIFIVIGEEYRWRLDDIFEMFVYAAMLYVSIWLFLKITFKWRKEKAYLRGKRKKRKSSYVAILKIFLEKEEMRKLGKSFFVKYNEVTGTKRRKYFGDVLISIEKDKNEIYIKNKEELYQKEFFITDIVSFKRVSAEGLGDVKGRNNHRQDINRVSHIANRANQLSLEAKLTSVSDRSGGLNTLHSNIIASKAIVREKQAKDELNSKIKQENKRLKDELEIRLLEFQDGDYLLISCPVSPRYGRLVQEVKVIA